MQRGQRLLLLLHRLLLLLYSFHCQRAQNDALDLLLLLGMMLRSRDSHTLAEGESAMHALVGERTRLRLLHVQNLVPAAREHLLLAQDCSCRTTVTVPKLFRQLERVRGSGHCFHCVESTLSVPV